MYWVIKGDMLVSVKNKMMVCLGTCMFSKGTGCIAGLLHKLFKLKHLAQLRIESIVYCVHEVMENSLLFKVCECRKAKRLRLTTLMFFFRKIVISYSDELKKILIQFLHFFPPK
jgi:hypothetical protein